MENNAVRAARAYLRDLEDGVAEEQLATHFHPDVVQQEHPNALVPSGARRGLDQLLEGSRRGRQVVSGQRYVVQNVVADGEQVALEVNWSAQVKVPLRSLQPGDTIRARFAVFLTFRDGRIVSQRNFDCFDPF